MIFSVMTFLKVPGLNWNWHCILISLFIAVIISMKNRKSDFSTFHNKEEKLTLLI